MDNSKNYSVRKRKYHEYKKENGDETISISISSIEEVDSKKTE